ncbi:hypothetical protein R3P38DRAFT_3122345 [Favolaschia claudopus]|uniref:Uncharacterized protein n=1 Tax=Favolaschia claudopus TaxID=2862362 RepID=A0AAV9ZDU6_9AGAR
MASNSQSTLGELDALTYVQVKAMFKTAKNPTASIDDLRQAAKIKLRLNNLFISNLEHQLEQSSRQADEAEAQARLITEDNQMKSDRIDMLKGQYEEMCSRACSKRLKADIQQERATKNFAVKAGKENAQNRKTGGRGLKSKLARKFGVKAPRS